MNGVRQFLTERLKEDGSYGGAAALFVSVAIAVDDDLVGVYTRGPGVLDLTRWIADDLREARVRLVRNHERLQGKRA